jgi:hypothetical protein
MSAREMPVGLRAEALNQWGWTRGVQGAEKRGPFTLGSSVETHRSDGFLRWGMSLRSLSKRAPSHSFWVGKVFRIIHWDRGAVVSGWMLVGMSLTSALDRGNGAIIKYQQARAAAGRSSCSLRLSEFLMAAASKVRSSNTAKRPTFRMSRASAATWRGFMAVI